MYIFDFLTGIVVFLDIITCVSHHSTSTHNDKGVTSISNISLTALLPDNIPHWIAAHRATASSGLTVAFGSLPKLSFTSLITAGTLVLPQISMISSISDGANPLSLMASFTGLTHLSSRSAINLSNHALVRVSCICFGVPSDVAIKGIFISTLSVDESCFLTFSASSFNLCIAIGLVLKSIPSFALN